MAWDSDSEDCLSLFFLIWDQNVAKTGRGLQEFWRSIGLLHSDFFLVRIEKWQTELEFCYRLWRLTENGKLRVKRLCGMEFWQWRLPFFNFFNIRPKCRKNREIAARNLKISWSLAFRLFDEDSVAMQNQWDCVFPLNHLSLTSS